MRFASLILFVSQLALAQQPIGIGPARETANPGIVKYFDWYQGTPSGCSAGSGYCVGHMPQGDFYYWSAWLPNASGLPAPNGLPIVGTFNDGHAGGCAGNIGILQLDKWGFDNPNASHISVVNCMASYSENESTGIRKWYGNNTSNDANAQIGNNSWKSRVPFSKGGLLYLPVERQIHAGGPSIHDASFVVSPDSGKHWCNPYSLFHGTTPGTCDSSNWQADGDAPKCGATVAKGPCLDVQYTDPDHSAIMWKALPLGIGGENWAWINFGNQDGKDFPGGVPAPFDPNVNTCFMLMPGDGSIGCVSNTSSILDISAWKYYTCPAMTESYRCDPADPASWTPTFANRTSVLHLGYSGSWENNGQVINPYTVLYVKEFGSYLMLGQSYHAAWAPSPIGPWRTIYLGWPGPAGNMLAPALGYRVISTNPPHVQVGASSNTYEGGEGSPTFSLWDLVLGRNMAGEAFQSDLMRTSPTWVKGAGYQFSDGHITGSFPRKGVVWSFDFFEHAGGGAAWPWGYFWDRANNAAVIAPCNAGTVWAPTLCGVLNSGRGTNLNNYGIATGNPGYNAHFNTFNSTADIKLVGASTPAATPSSMLGNGSYSVVTVVRYEGDSPFRKVGIWSGGSATALQSLHGNLLLDHGSYHYTTSFTFPNTSNWYFIATTVQPQTGGCGANCIPTAKVWVGGATTPGDLTDVNAGVSGGSTATPNVGAGPFLIGTNTSNTNQDSPLMSFATMIVYSRALTQAEVSFMYRSMKTKMATRGVALQ